jgi:hypothetical protein
MSITVSKTTRSISAAGWLVIGMAAGFLLWTFSAITLAMVGFWPGYAIANAPFPAFIIGLISAVILYSRRRHYGVVAKRRLLFVACGLLAFPGLMALNTVISYPGAIIFWPGAHDTIPAW